MVISYWNGPIRSKPYSFHIRSRPGRAMYQPGRAIYLYIGIFLQELILSYPGGLMFMYGYGDPRNLRGGKIIYLMESSEFQGINGKKLYNKSEIKRIISYNSQ